MHAQQATREAQREQAQLSEMLKQTLQQLGMAMTPNRSPAGTPDGEWSGSGGTLDVLIQGRCCIGFKDGGVSSWSWVVQLVPGACIHVGHLGCIPGMACRMMCVFDA